MSEYEDMTPKELNILASVKQQKEEQKLEYNVIQAWFTEYYHRVKKLPSLTEALEDLKPKKEQTVDDMLAVVKALNAKFGGKVVEANKEMAD